MALHLVTRGLGRLRSLLSSTWGLGRSGGSGPEIVYSTEAAFAVSANTITSATGARSRAVTTSAHSRTLAGGARSLAVAVSASSRTLSR